MPRYAVAPQRQTDRQGLIVKAGFGSFVIACALINLGERPPFALASFAANPKLLDKVSFEARACAGFLKPQLVGGFESFAFGHRNNAFAIAGGSNSPRVGL
jgi:hypothetical protein